MTKEKEGVITYIGITERINEVAWYSLGSLRYKCGQGCET